nr:phage tail tube protein [uncultured Massilia sp.]
MADASGVFKQLTYKVETTYGVMPAAATAQSLRRVTSSLDLTKDTYQSNEMSPDQQVGDFRHGLRKVGGTVNGELSAKTYSDFIAAGLKKDFVAGVSITGASITVGGAAGAWTLTRAAGSWLTDGIKVGDVVRLTAGAFNASNVNKNFMVTGITATVLTGMTLNASAMVAEGPVASATLAVVGKKSFAPQTGHTDKSFAFEHWQPDVGATGSSEVFTGCKVSKVSFNFPATGIATVAVEFVGKDMTPGTAQYFTNPTPVTVTGVMAAVNGVVKVGSVTGGTITSASIEISSAQSSEPGIGGNTADQAGTGRIIVTGQITAKFNSTALRDAFVNETETSIYLAFTSDNTASSDFLAFSMSRVKLNGASKDDGEKIIIQTVPYQALRDNAGGAGKATEMTTLTVQDSAA